MSRWYWAALALAGGILVTWGMDYVERSGSDAARFAEPPAAARASAAK